MRVIFLGTNGWYNTNTGNTICTLIETDKYYIVLDAGNGIYKLDQHIITDKPIYLFLSHFHLDHIEGLHILSKFRFKQGIHIYGQKGTVNKLNTIINEPYTVNFEDLIMDVRIHELDEGTYNINAEGNVETLLEETSFDDEFPFIVRSKFLIHASPCLGYRIQTNNKTITYGTDTGICPELIELAKDADLLITECSFKIGQKNENWPHLNPEDAIKIARQSGAKKLALTHFDANIYRKLEERTEIKEKMKDKFKNINIAYDNKEINF